MKKVLIVLTVLSIILGGCSIDNERKVRDRIEDELKTKYGEDFEILHARYMSGGSVLKFSAQLKGEDGHLFYGKMNEDFEIIDSYIETTIAEEMSQFYTDQLQVIIPGAVVLITPDEPTLTLSNRIVPKKHWSLNEYLEAYKLDALDNENSLIGFIGAILIPYSELDVDFDTYKEVTESIFNKELSDLSFFFMKYVHIYSTESELNELVSNYHMGWFYENILNEIEESFPIFLENKDEILNNYAKFKFSRRNPSLYYHSKKEDYKFDYESRMSKGVKDE